jgi:hypothetical protein
MAVVVPDDGIDSVGLYFDNAGMMENMTMQSSGQVTIYIVLAGVSAPSVAAWELGLDFDSTLGLIIDAGLQDDEVNFANLPMFIVGLGTPRPPDADGNFVLAMPTFLILVPDSVIDFYAGPSDPSSLDPPLPDYVNGEDITEIIPMNYSVDAGGQNVGDDGWCLLVIASINGEPSVATEDATWTSVKNLYR